MNGEASLWLEEFRGEVTATMVYDGAPIHDHFKVVDDRTLMGIMNGKGEVDVSRDHRGTCTSTSSGSDATCIYRRRELAPIVATMKRHARRVLAALILMGAIAGCSSTTSSPPAASTAPSSAKSTSAKSTTSETPTTSETSSPTVPAPPNSLTITCKDWRALDDPTQLAVVTAIVTQPNFKGAVTDPDAARVLAKGACLLFGSKTVNDVLLTGS
jgi:Domain of unknown function (DUF4334)